MYTGRIKGSEDDQLGGEAETADTRGEGGGEVGPPRHRHLHH